MMGSRVAYLAGSEFVILAYGYLDPSGIWGSTIVSAISFIYYNKSWLPFQTLIESQKASISTFMFVSAPLLTLKMAQLLTKKGINKSKKNFLQSFLFASYFDKFACLDHCLLAAPHSLAYNLLQ